VILAAKTEEALIFFQKQFKNRSVVKKYLALAIGNVRDDQGVIENLIGRSPKDGKKQKCYLPFDPDSGGKRTAVTEYRVLERYKDFTFLELSPKTGRKHQIRCQLANMGNPIAGDKVYGYKGQPCPDGLKRQFLHASYIKIMLPNGEYKDFKSELPEELKICLPN